MLNFESQSSASVSFREFWEYIAHELGDAWLGVNPDATCLKDFVILSYDPKDYLREVIVQSYKRNRCSNLDSAVGMNAVLDILGEVAYGLRGAQKDDLFDIELLEEIAWHIGNRFAHLIEFDPHRPGAADDSKAQVISFPEYRIRKANARL